MRSGGKLTDADREIVVVIRKLGHFMDELERLEETRYVRWKAVFETVRKEVSRQASPKEWMCTPAKGATDHEQQRPE